MNDLINWLLEGSPWIRYRTLIDMLNKPEDDPDVLEARQAALADLQVQALLAELLQWSGPELRGHNNAGHHLHKLTFIADLGLNVKDPEMDTIINSILQHQSLEGPFQILINLPVHYGGSGVQSSNECKIGAETLLTLWEQSRERHPYMFYMGTDFTKLKAPLIWYDMLHVLDILTQFPWLHSDVRLKEMVDIVGAKADEMGRFTPESIWKAWTEWEFGQKKEPSKWLTLIAQRILIRYRINKL
ncbi:MAG: hypothetical protein M1371_03065 [Actinobacteria bacterium]|nr:hypothetical protein [Actinomycetota bacterium]